LAHIFKIYGDEKQSLTIAKAIDRYRQRKPIETTKELAKIIVKAKHRHEDNVVEARKR
jgi:16S rRNA (cytosine1402-N4)-methyltransferase